MMKLHPDDPLYAARQQAPNAPFVDLASPASSIGNGLSIIVWREWGDDDDSLRITPYSAATYDEAVSVDSIRIDNNIEPPEDQDDETRIYEGAGTAFITNDINIHDGEIIAYNGRRFRINVTEIKGGI